MDLIQEFVKERNAALLSMDEEKIRAMFRKWGGPGSRELPTDPVSFWGAVHKAVTGVTSFPIEFRQKSKKWLDEHGLRSHDDFDLDQKPPSD